MSSRSKVLSYSNAINEVLAYYLANDPNFVVIGQGVKSPWYVGSTCNDLVNTFGEEHVIDTPVSENCITGVAVGAAIAGLKPIIVHPRMDFMLYAFDPIINQAANWSYMNGGRSNVPVVFWGVINRGGEQAAQHSQAFYSVFAHIPGLKVIAPSTPGDVKGLLSSAIKDPNPVVFVDDRWLYGVSENVPEEMYDIPIGKGKVKKEGKDVSIISFSYTMLECIKAGDILEKQGVNAELIDLRSIKPYDKELITETVSKTGRVVLVDGSWKTGGFSSELSAFISENLFKYLKSPVVRVCLPDIPAPASGVLESEYYITADKIVNSVKHIL